MISSTAKAVVGFEWASCGAAEGRTLSKLGRRLKASPSGCARPKGSVVKAEGLKYLDRKLSNGRRTPAKNYCRCRNCFPTQSRRTDQRGPRESEWDRGDGTRNQGRCGRRPHSCGWKTPSRRAAAHLFAPEQTQRLCHYGELSGKQADGDAVDSGSEEACVSRGTVGLCERRAFTFDQRRRAGEYVDEGGVTGFEDLCGEGGGSSERRSVGEIARRSLDCDRRWAPGADRAGGHPSGE